MNKHWLFNSILFLVSLLPLQNPSFPVGFMGNLPNSIAHSVSSDFQDEFINSDLISKALKNPTDRCSVLKYGSRESDLHSRWLNVLRVEPKTTNACFEAYWSSAPQTFEEIINELSLIESNFTLYSDKDDYVKFKDSIPANINLVLIQ